MNPRRVCVKISPSPSLLLPGTNASIFALLYVRLSHPSLYHPGLLDPGKSGLEKGPCLTRDTSKKRIVGLVLVAFQDTSSG